MGAFACRYVHRKLGDYEGAAQDYNEALQRGEANVRAYTNFAFCLAKLGYYGRAVRAYDAVLELDPANENALHNRCASMQDEGSAQTQFAASAAERRKTIQHLLDDTQDLS